jgi:hypothetical protein
MKKSFKSALIALTALLFIGAVALSIRAHQADSDEKPKKSETSEKSHSGRHSEGVKLDRETQERIGIELQQLKPATGKPEATIYGTLEEDPSEQFVLRSPLTGVVVSNGSWPMIGARVAAGAQVGAIRPRLTPIDQLALHERLASTHGEVEAAQSAVATAREEVNRLRELNADDKNASDKALQEAQTRLATEEARLKAAQTSERLIGSSLQTDSDAGSVALAIRKGGQVLEVSAQPGESVESGQTLIRVANFDRLLARLYVPPGQVVKGSVTRAMIKPVRASTKLPMAFILSQPVRATNKQRSSSRISFATTTHRSPSPWQKPERLEASNHGHCTLDRIRTANGIHRSGKP